MRSFDNIRRAVEATIDEDIRDVCLRLVDEIEKHQCQTDSLWTYQVFSSWLHSAEDELVQESVNFLASARSARLLQVHFLAFDPADPEDIGVFVDNREVADAYSTGVLFHPDTGLKVEDFENWLVPYFTLEPGSGAQQSDG